MKKLFCTLLSAAAAVALLCGFTPSPQENSAGAGLITKTYETAEAISSLSVSDKYADVTVKADDVDHVVVEYSYNSSYNDAFGTGGDLYSFTIAGPSLNIQGLKGDASMSVNNSKCICTMTVKLPRRAFAGLTVDTSNGNLTIQDMTSQSNTLTTTNGNISITGGSLDNLNATANNGKVEVNNLLTQTFAASTRNGRISLANTSALSITAQAQNGDVKLDHTSSPYFYCTATNASVVGTVTGRGAEYGLNLTAGSGRVTLTDANDDSFAIRSSAPVQQNLGAAQSFTANASNGNVNLEFVQ